MVLQGEVTRDQGAAQGVQKEDQWTKKGQRPQDLSYSLSRSIGASGHYTWVITNRTTAAGRAELQRCPRPPQQAALVQRALWPPRQAASVPRTLVDANMASCTNADIVSKGAYKLLPPCLASLCVQVLISCCHHVLPHVLCTRSGMQT